MTINQLIKNMDTSEYQFSHGHKPKGYGLWMFEVDGQIVNGHGTLKQAAQEAILTSNVKNATSIKVLP